jgi:hypothetical protein
MHHPPGDGRAKEGFPPGHGANGSQHFFLVGLF